MPGCFCSVSGADAGVFVLVSDFAAAVTSDSDATTIALDDSSTDSTVVVDSVLVTMDSSISCTTLDTGMGLDGSDLVHRRLCMSFTFTLFFRSRGLRDGFTGSTGVALSASAFGGSSPSARVFGFFGPPRSATAFAAASRHALSTLLALSIKYLCIVPLRVDLVVLVAIFHPRNARPANAVSRFAAARSDINFLLFL